MERNKGEVSRGVKMKCEMEGCTREAIEELVISEHPYIRADLNLPEKITKLQVCAFHALEWKIGWLLAEEYEVPVTTRLIDEFLTRAFAEAEEMQRAPP